MKHLLKQAIAFLLAFALLFTTVPAAFAAEDDGFTDVPESHWAYDAIRDAVAKGLFNGMGDGTFAPDGILTRAMLVTVLARAAEAEVDDGTESGFQDVPAGLWYTGAVVWAAVNGIVNGDGKGNFFPDGTATREQTAVILNRYAQFAGLTLPETAEEKEFTDQGAISAWAVEAVKALQMAGVLSGYPDGSFQPQGFLTRAEAASLFSRFLAAVAEEPQPTEPSQDTEPSEDPDPSEDPGPTDASDPTEAPEPIKVAFVVENAEVLVDGAAVTEVTLDAGTTSLEFIVKPTDGYEVYDAVASDGRLNHSGRNYILAGLTGDTIVTLTVDLVQHTVSFNATNGTEPVKVKVTHGQPVEKPADPVKTDDEFQGWYDVTGEAWDFTTPVMNDMTLFAYWLNDTFVDVTIYLDGVNGNDNNDGQTPDTAVKTFAKAASMVSPKVSNGVIYVTNTVTVDSEETWTMGGKDCIVKRAESCTDNMVAILDGGSLTLDDITLDGNRAYFSTLKTVKGNTVYLENAATLTINEGAVICNGYGSQGGGVYGKNAKGATGDTVVILDGGKIVENEAKYTGGGLYMTGASTSSYKAVFTMNGGEISRNQSGTSGAAINFSTGPMQVELNAGAIEDNVTKFATYATIAYSSDPKYQTSLCLKDVTMRSNVSLEGEEILGITSSYSNVYLYPSADTAVEQCIRISNSTTSTKAYAMGVAGSLGVMPGKLEVRLYSIFVGAVVVYGVEDYQLTQADLDKIELVHEDYAGAYQMRLDQETNSIVIEQIPNHDLIIYLSGTKGNDANDGETETTAVKTFARAKELLKAKVDAQEAIPADANFVISVLSKVTLTEDIVLSFADFGEDASRCMIRRDASYSSGNLIQSKGFDVTFEDVTIDGNSAYVKKNTQSLFSISDGANVTVNDGTVFCNIIAGGSGGLFNLGSSKTEPTRLTFNGGYIHHLTSGSGGAIVYLSGLNITNYLPAQCVVNDILVEDCTFASGPFFAANYCELTFNGGVIRNNESTTGRGRLAVMNGGKSCKITVNSPAEGTTMEYDGDIYLQNTTSDSEGNISLMDGVYVTIGGPLKTKLGLGASMMMFGVVLAEGEDYTLTEADLAMLYAISGDRLRLNTKTNRIEIAKSME